MVLIVRDGAARTTAPRSTGRRVCGAVILALPSSRRMGQALAIFEIFILPSMLQYGILNRNTRIVRADAWIRMEQNSFLVALQNFVSIFYGEPQLTRFIQFSARTYIDYL